ncbi:MAG: DUF192 domain-containing protein [Candidatus Limnocylindrales bacterium]
MTIPLELRNITRGTAVATQVAAADSFWARFMGLMGRASLGPQEGLWLPGTNNIHMFFMRFAIDCCFVGLPTADGTRPVTALRRGLPPWRGIVWYERGAHGVVELPVGALERSATQVGDRVTLTQRGAGPI